MTALTEVFVAVLPDMDKFTPEVKRKLAQIDKQIGAKEAGSKVAGRFGVGFNGAFGGIVKHSAGLFVGAFAAIKGVQFLGGFINDARESAKVGRISAAVIKSTGGVAGITAAQIGDLATAISNKTGADDEAIQSGENLLATFTNVRNETGKGNDIFNRATQAAVDMAAAMNGGVVDANGLKSANIQLGKALNDPVKGVTALSKVGVSFTQQQKDQIKTLVDSGKTLEAQKIILGEVGKEFGGAAAAAADPLSRLKTIAGNLAEGVGGLLLPTVDKFANFLANTAVPGIQAMGAAFQGEGVTSDGFVGVMERIGVAARGAFDFFKSDVLPRLREFGGVIKDEVVPRLVDFGGFFRDQILPRLKDFGGFIVGTVVPAVGNLVASLTPLAKDVGTAAVGIFEKLGPILQSIGGFIKDTIVPAVVDFTKWLKDNSTVVGAVAVGVGAMVVAFQAYQVALTIVGAATKAYAAVQAALNLVMSLNPIGIVVLALVGLAAGLVYAYKKSETFRDIVNGVFGAVRDFAVGAFKAVVGAVKTAIDWVKNNWPLLLAILTGPIGLAVLAIIKHWDKIKAGGKAVIDWIVQTFPKVVGWITAPFVTVVQALGTAWGTIKSAAKTAIKFVVDKFLGLVESILTGAGKAFGWVPGLGDKLKGAATEFGKFRDSVNAKLDGINDEPVDIKVGLAYTQALGQATKKMKFATGGGVFGAGSGTSDSIPALLSNGEHVLTAKEVVGAGGHKAVEQMRSEWSKGYAKGGVVVDPEIPSSRRLSLLANAAAGGVGTAGTAVAQAIAKQLVKMQSNPGLAGVLSFVKSQVGKPYVWGGVGPGGYDCSGLVSAAINTAFGRNPYRRLGATGSMPWSMFASGPGAFEVGWFQGNPGHTAATVNGVNIESSGGRGVHMGSGARGARNALFTRRAHVKGFRDGGIVGDAPYDSLHNKKQLMKELGIDLFDKGGQWKSGTIGANMSGRTETVLPDAGQVELGLKTINAIADAVAARPTLLDGRRVDQGFSRRALGGGY